LLLVFAVFSTNRGYAGSIGFLHVAYPHTVPLNLPRAHLNVPEDHATTYRRVVFLIDAHGKDGELLAGPDCPEVYFLAGRLNPLGTTYDFLALESEGSHVDDVSHWTPAKVIVLNSRPDFSPAVTDGVLSELRGAFPNGEQVDRFEVRWR
jgi:hypothetical protein